MNQDYDLKLSHVSVSYGSVEALKDVSFEVKKNDFIGIIGPNDKRSHYRVITIQGLQNN
jgi:ABC-type branched-subunit amino acid transport system ATPase component